MKKHAKKIAKKIAENVGVRKKSIPQHIAQYYSDTEIVNKPFYFEGTNGKSILLLHGWTSTPYEMRALGEYLHKEGYTVYAPLLKGHGTKPEDLEGVLWQDWRRDVREAYQALHERSEQVFVGGMSLGGSLALHLAQSHPEIAGLILMGTPYKMRYEHIGFYLTRLAMLLRTYKTKHYPKIIGSDMCMTQMISYQRYPIKSAYEAFFAIKSSTLRLEKITAPSMIIQSRDDHLVARTSMKALEKDLGSSYVKRRKIKNAYHNFIGDSKNHYLFPEIAQFLAQCTS